jgi:hypothetical protein
MVPGVEVRGGVEGAVCGTGSFRISSGRPPGELLAVRGGSLTVGAPVGEFFSGGAAVPPSTVRGVMLMSGRASRVPNSAGGVAAEVVGPEVVGAAAVEGAAEVGAVG